MNRKNARFIGREDGKLYQSNGDLDLQEYLQAGQQRVDRMYGVAAKTRAEFQAGWNEVHHLPAQSQPVKTHNSNTRFCDCPECI